MTETLAGGCYCGAIRYEVSAKPVFKAQCHCRPCQMFSGGGPNYFMLVPKNGVRFTAGTPSSYTRPDLPDAVTRQFCGRCGTHMTTIRDDLGMVVIKVGTLDDPSVFRGPKAAIYMKDSQPFHVVPEGVPCFDETPS